MSQWLRSQRRSGPVGAAPSSMSLLSKSVMFAWLRGLKVRNVAAYMIACHCQVAWDWLLNTAQRQYVFRVIACVSALILVHDLNARLTFQSGMRYEGARTIYLQGQLEHSLQGTIDTLIILPTLFGKTCQLQWKLRCLCTFRRTCWTCSKNPRSVIYKWH